MTPIVRARWQLTACGLAVVTLLAVLPGPLAAVGALNVAGRGAGLVDAAALLIASSVVWMLAGWGVAVLALAVLARVPGAAGRWGSRLLSRVTPVVVRRAVIAGVGLSMLAGATACATDTGRESGAGEHADIRYAAAGSNLSGPDLNGSALDEALPGLDHGLGEPGIGPGSSHAGPESEPATGAVAAPNLDWPIVAPGSPDLDWPDTPESSAGDRPAPKNTPRPGPAVEPVVVLAGDTLWSIAAEHLGPGVDDVAIDTAWHAWYATNRDVIGDDPDLILPGQRLRPPADNGITTTTNTPTSPATNTVGAAGAQNGDH